MTNCNLFFEAHDLAQGKRKKCRKPATTAFGDERPMTAADKLKKYLQLEEMEKGTVKDTLNKLLDKVNEKNAKYVLNILQTDVDAFLTDKCCEVPRRSTSLAELKQQYAVKCLHGIFVDFDVMTNFKPEIGATEAEGISEVEANNLLRKLRRESLMQFLQSLEESIREIEAQIMQKHPLLATPHMAEVLHDRVNTAKRAIYYKCLKAAVGGTDFEIKKEKECVVQENPFFLKHQGRCPHCLKVADVSPFTRIRIKCSYCKKQRSIWNWFCLKCSRKNGKEAAVRKSKGYDSVKRARKNEEGSKGKSKSPAQSKPATDDSVKRARTIEEGSKGKGESPALSKPAKGLRKFAISKHFQYVRFLNCVHYADLLSKQGKDVLSCPQTTGHGWRHLVKLNLTKMKGQAGSMVEKCYECKSNWSIKQWFCTKCSGKGPDNADVKFQDCDCYTRLHHPLRAISKKILTTRIQLRCPLHSCQAKRHFEEQDLPWVKKVRQSASTYMKCGVCGRRHSVWEWHCFKCKMKVYKCVCEKPQKQ